MTRKDFELIARIFEMYARPDLPDSREHEMLTNIAGDMADALHATNPNFDRARFLKACGVAS